MHYLTALPTAASTVEAAEPLNDDEISVMAAVEEPTAVEEPSWDEAFEETEKAWDEISEEPSEEKKSSE
jgi:hypothetical protein